MKKLLVMVSMVALACSHPAPKVAPAPSIPSAVAEIRSAPTAQSDSACAVRFRSTTAPRPLFVVDGKLLTCSQWQALPNNPGDIERVDVIKGRRAEALYGAQFPGGLIWITTKKKP
jgi:hypothetical protein